MSKKLQVSLITTERNEADAIAEFIESALAQSLPPDEIIIADGGSTDGTLDVIERYIKKGAPINLVHAPGNRSVGRNAAVKAARNNIIACTDVGSRLDANWLKHITQPLKDNPKAGAVAGFFLPEPQTYFERVSSTLMLGPNDQIDLSTWLPSSRSVAFTKEAWAKAGGYPEHTNFNEDTPFDLALKQAGYKFEDGLKAIAYWRPRPNLREFFRQYYFYAVGDGIDGYDVVRINKLTTQYALFLVALVGSALISVPIVILLLVVLGLKLARRVYGPWKKLGGVHTLALMIILIITYDISQISGYWNGYINREKLRGSKRLVR